MKNYRTFRLVRAAVAILVSLLLMSCTSLSYYGQSVSGQWEIMTRRRPLTQLIADPGTDSRLSEKLRQVMEIRDFASRRLGLPDNDSYRSYVRLDRKYVVWNIIAAPELSLEPVQWCFLFVGCLPYRGYFHRQAALDFAERLKGGDYDVYTGGVSAYSTLGWFDDPVLSTMLNRNITDTARIIFHELAHQHTYIKNDTDFNEAFADTVAQIGVGLWLSAKGRKNALTRYKTEQRHEQEFYRLVSFYKSRLSALYAGDIPKAEKLARKSAIFKEMVADYHKIRSGWGGDHAYDNWFDEGLNNAKLASVLTYRQLVPAFLAVYESVGRDLGRFYQRVDELAQCDPSQRRHYLEAGLRPQGCGK